MRALGMFALVGLALALGGCGGGGGGGGGSSTPPPAAQNVQPISVDAGPASVANIVFVSVTVCAPGSSDQLPDHRSRPGRHRFVRLASALVGAFAGAGVAAAARRERQSARRVRAVRRRLQLGIGETRRPAPSPANRRARCRCMSSAIPRSSRFRTAARAPGRRRTRCRPSAPTACSGSASSSRIAAAPARKKSLAVPTTAVPRPAASQRRSRLPSSCKTRWRNSAWTTTARSLSSAAIPAAGAATAAGFIIFGIGTQTNNALGSAKVLTTDPETGYIVTAFNGQTYTTSYIDSGSSVVLHWYESLPDVYGYGVRLLLSGDHAEPVGDPGGNQRRQQRCVVQHRQCRSGLLRQSKLFCVRRSRRTGWRPDGLRLGARPSSTGATSTPRSRPSQRRAAPGRTSHSRAASAPFLAYRAAWAVGFGVGSATRRSVLWSV